MPEPTCPCCGAAIHYQGTPPKRLTFTGMLQSFTAALAVLGASKAYITFRPVTGFRPALEVLPNATHPHLFPLAVTGETKNMHVYHRLAVAKKCGKMLDELMKNVDSEWLTEVTRDAVFGQVPSGKNRPLTITCDLPDRFKNTNLADAYGGLYVSDLNEAYVNENVLGHLAKVDGKQNIISRHVTLFEELSHAWYSNKYPTASQFLAHLPHGKFGTAEEERYLREARDAYDERFGLEIRTDTPFREVVPIYGADLWKHFVSDVSGPMQPENMKKLYGVAWNGDEATTEARLAAFAAAGRRAIPDDLRREVVEHEMHMQSLARTIVDGHEIPAALEQFENRTRELRTKLESFDIRPSRGNLEAVAANENGTDYRIAYGDAVHDSVVHVPHGVHPSPAAFRLAGHFARGPERVTITRSQDTHHNVVTMNPSGAWFHVAEIANVGEPELHAALAQCIPRDQCLSARAMVIVDASLVPDIETDELVSRLHEVRDRYFPGQFQYVALDRFDQIRELPMNRFEANPLSGRFRDPKTPLLRNRRLYPEPNRIDEPRFGPPLRKKSLSITSGASHDHNDLLN